jgi:hypothetical protein
MLSGTAVIHTPAEQHTNQQDGPARSDSNASACPATAERHEVT